VTQIIREDDDEAGRRSARESGAQK